MRWWALRVSEGSIMKFTRRLIQGLVAALMVMALVVPVSAAKAGQVSTLYLEKHKKQYILTDIVPDHKGARHEEAKINLKKPGGADYKELGTWESAPAASTSRVIDLGAANLWLSADVGKKEQAAVYVKVEVLKNGAVEVTRETGVITLLHKEAAVAIDLPAPRPAIELAAGDVFGLRVSVRDGGGVSSLPVAPSSTDRDDDDDDRENEKSYEVQLDYGGAKAASNFTLEIPTGAGAIPAAGLIEVGQPSAIDAIGTIYITPPTPIYIHIAPDIDINTVSITVSSPAIGTVPFPAAQDLVVIRLLGAPLGAYVIRVNATTLAGVARSDLLEVTLVDVLPVIP